MKTAQAVAIAEVKRDPGGLIDYIRIARLDHWVKNVFVLPGTAAALFVDRSTLSAWSWMAFALGMLALTVVLRVIFRRPWIVEAGRADGMGRMQWAVVGWRRSGRVIAEVAQSISVGHGTMQPEGARPHPPRGPGVVP